MPSELWNRVEELYHSAAGIGAERRAAFLQEKCGSDVELLKEVQSLLLHEDSVEEFIERPAFHIATELMAEEIADEQETVQAAIDALLPRFRVLEKLGAGGMGVVYKAEDTKLRRLVALKFLPPEYSRDPEALRRFQGEAFAISALNHPNICTVYDVEERQGQPFIVMELLEGQTLDHRIGAKALAASELIELAIQISDALDAAHAKSIIHRDIKPSNVFLTVRGQPKILDFGLAKLFESEFQGVAGCPDAGLVDCGEPWSPVRTRAGMAMGTAAYMSPEQVRGERLDARTDLFSFGLVLYEMASGQRAFPGESRVELYQAIQTRAPRPVRQLRRELPAKMEEIISKALAKDREVRYQSAAEMRAELIDLRQRLQPKPRLVGSRALGAGCLLILVCGALWFLLHRPFSRVSRPVPPEFQQQQLTDNSNENAVASGALSPDGKYLAYSDSNGIKIKTLGSEETRPLPPPDSIKNEAVDWQVRSWFPDGHRLLANAIRRGIEPWEIGSPETSVWILSLSGEAQKLRDSAFAYSVSPDGSQVLFGENWGGTGDREIWVMSSAGQGARKLYFTDDAVLGAAVWSPDGKQIAFKAATSLVVGDLEGSPPRLLIRSGPGADTPQFPPGTNLMDYLWMSDGRLVYSLHEATPHTSNCNLWEIRLDAATGKAREGPRRLTNWSGFCVSFAGASADAHELALRKWRTEVTTYLADLDASGSYISNPRHLPSESLGTVHRWYTAEGWTPDGKTIILTDSQRIATQSLNADALRVIASAAEGARDVHVTADNKWVLYLSQEDLSSDKPPEPMPVMRVPIEGGLTEPVFTVQPSSRLKCSAAPSRLCLIAEPHAQEREVAITAFDPLKGRGAELTRLALAPDTDYWDFDLSPDGERMAIFQGNAGPVHIVSLQGRPIRDVLLKDWTHLRSVTWTADGKGLFVSDGYDRPEGAVLLHVTLDGRSTVMWHQLRALSVAPAPDGRHLAFTGVTSEANVWMIENF